MRPLISTVSSSIDESSDVKLQTDDSEGVVARVAADDGRSDTDRATLLGAAFELLSLVRNRAGSEDKARWNKAVEKRKV